MTTETTKPPPLRSPVDPALLKDYLRKLVPCDSADPLVVHQYEQALAEWAGKTDWRRAVEGFERYVAAELATIF